MLNGCERQSVSRIGLKRHCNKLPILILTLELWLGLSASVVGQAITTEGQPAYKLNPVVVTATASPTTLNNTTASVTIITREEIEAQHAVSVVEVLR